MHVPYQNEPAYRLSRYIAIHVPRTLVRLMLCTRIPLYLVPRFHAQLVPRTYAKPVPCTMYRMQGTYHMQQSCHCRGVGQHLNRSVPAPHRSKKEIHHMLGLNQQIHWGICI